MPDPIQGGNITTLPADNSCCGIKPSKEALETGFEIDFSKAKEFTDKKRDDKHLPLSSG